MVKRQGRKRKVTRKSRPADPRLKVFGSTCRALRLRHEWSQDELARRSGIATQQYTRYERGEQQPGVLVALDIANALSTSVDILLRGLDGTHITISRH